MDIETADQSFVASASAAAGGAPFLKATAHTEGDARFLYIEPTNEDRDIQGQVVPQTVLARSAAYYQRFGNIDLGHKTHPAIVKKLGIENPREWEIGRPVEVKVDPQIMVKAQIYAGHEKADWFWKTQVGQRPPMPWFPSIGGASVVDADGVVTQALWDNIGLDANPVNKTVPHCTILPPAAFLKALVGGDGGTDTATLTGGSAARRESLRGADRRQGEFFAMSAGLLASIKAGQFYLGESPSRADTLAAIEEYFRSRGVGQVEAADYAKRFVMTVGERFHRAHPQAQAA